MYLLFKTNRTRFIYCTWGLQYNIYDRAKVRKFQVLLVLCTQWTSLLAMKVYIKDRIDLKTSSITSAALHAMLAIIGNWDFNPGLLICPLNFIYRTVYPKAPGQHHSSSPSDGVPRQTEPSQAGVLRQTLPEALPCMLKRTREKW